MSRRKRYIPDGTVEYRGHIIGITEQGQFSCREFGIVDDTFDGLKKAIRERETKRTNLPRQDVLFQSTRFGTETGTFIQGSTTSIGVGYRSSYVWVTWKDSDGHSHREQMYGSRVYLNTLENRALVHQINELELQKAALNKSIEELTNQLVSVEIIEGEE